MSQPIIEYDTNGKVIFYENSYGIKEWLDSDGNLTRLIDPNAEDGFEEIHYNSKGVEIYKRASWEEQWYNEQGHIIRLRSSSGFETWYDYDENGCLIYSKSSDGDMWWYSGVSTKPLLVINSDGTEKRWKYDCNNNKTYYKHSNGIETWFDSNGKITHKKYTDGSEIWFDDNGKASRYKDCNGVEKYYNSDGDEIPNPKSEV